MLQFFLRDGEELNDVLWGLDQDPTPPAQNVVLLDIENSINLLSQESKYVFNTSIMNDKQTYFSMCHSKIYSSSEWSSMISNSTHGTNNMVASIISGTDTGVVGIAKNIVIYIPDTYDLSQYQYIYLTINSHSVPEDMANLIHLNTKNYPTPESAKMSLVINGLNCVVEDDCLVVVGDNEITWRFSTVNMVALRPGLLPSTATDTATTHTKKCACNLAKIELAN